MSPRKLVQSRSQSIVAFVDKQQELFFGKG